MVHLDDGFDFLGFNVRRYGKKLLIKPSKAAVKRVRARLAAEMRALRGANASAVIATINPIVRGWAAYYRSAVSTDTFQALDNHLWKLTYKWALYRHKPKPGQKTSGVEDVSEPVHPIMNEDGDPPGAAPAAHDPSLMI